MISHSWSAKRLCVLQAGDKRKGSDTQSAMLTHSGRLLDVAEKEMDMVHHRGPLPKKQNTAHRIVKLTGEALLEMGR